MSFQQDEQEDKVSSHDSFENDSQGKPDIEIKQDENLYHNGTHAILEDDQIGNNNDQENSIEESLINICNGKDAEGRQSIIVVEEKIANNSSLQKNVSSGISPMPSAHAPVPITQEELALANSHDGQPEIVPFISDEQPIKAENTNSIISAAHEQEIEILDH